MIKLKMRQHGSIVQRSWFIWLVLLAVMQPDVLAASSAGVLLFNAINLAAFVVLLVDLACQKSYRLNTGSILIFLVQLCLVVSSVYNQANVVYTLKKLLMITNVAMLTSKNLQHNAARFIHDVYWLLYVCIVIHFLTLLLFPGGIFISYYEYKGTMIPYLKHWFLSTGNNYVLFVLPTMFLDRIRLYQAGKKTDVLSIALYVMGFIGMFKSVASTSLIACMLFVGFAVLLEWKKIPMPKLWVYVLIGVGAFILLVFFDFGSLLGNILGVGDVTFTGRTRTWQTAVDWIAKQPLLGYGYEKEALMISKFGGNNTATHCHNLYLDICYRSGIIGLSLFLTTLFQCSKPLARRKRHPLSILLSFTVFLYLGVLFQMEAYFNLTLFYMLLMFCFHCECWIDQLRPVNTEEGPT